MHGAGIRCSLNDTELLGLQGGERRFRHHDDEGQSDEGAIAIGSTDRHIASLAAIAGCARAGALIGRLSGTRIVFWLSCALKPKCTYQAIVMNNTPIVWRVAPGAMGVAPSFASPMKAMTPGRAKGHRRPRRAPRCSSPTFRLLVKGVNPGPIRRDVHFVRETPLCRRPPRKARRGPAQPRAGRPGAGVSVSARRGARRRRDRWRDG